MGRKKPVNKPAVAIRKERRWPRHALVLGILWAVTIFAYADSFSPSLVFDNHSIVAGDSRIRAATAQNAALIFSSDYWYGSGPTDLYRPLATLSYLVNYAVLGNGANAIGYHAVNLALHGLNVALVYLLGLCIFGELGAAAVMAALWAVHPVLIESVTNIVGRADELAALGVMGALLCHIQASRSTGRRNLWLGGVVLATAVGMFSKESAIAAPAVLVLYDLAFAKDGWRKRAQSYAAAIVPCLLYLLLRSRVLAQIEEMPVGFTDNPLTGWGFFAARLTAHEIIGRYLALMIWPGPLCYDYSYNQIQPFSSGGAAAVLYAAAALAALIGAFVAYRKDRRIFFFGLLFFVALAPVANVFLLIGTIMAERLLYLPALGVAGCAAVAWSFLTKRLSKRAAIAIPAVIVVALAIRTYARNNDWQTDVTLAESAEKIAPDAYRPHMILASFTIGRGSVDEAARMESILDPLPDSRNSFKAYINAGISYRLYGDRVAAADPAQAQGWYQKSLASLLHGESVAKADYQIAVDMNRPLGRKPKGFAGEKVYLELGATYVALKRPREALEALEKGRRLAARPEYYFEANAEAYRAMGDAPRAAVELMKAILMNGSQAESAPGEAASYNQRITSKLVELYGVSDPQGCAVVEMRGVRTINPNCPRVAADICAAFRGLAGEYKLGAPPAGCPAN